MPKITYVKKAQQRYATVPVLDENGEQKKVPVTVKNGEQKVTKHGRPVFRSVTVSDYNKPLPNHTCGKCGNEIKVGDPYMWIAPKSGPYGGTKMYRCGTCPRWQVWEYSSSLSARLAQVVHEGEESLGSCVTRDDFDSAVEEIASQIQEISEEQEEKADKIEYYLAHETSMSEELREQAQELESWADEVRDSLDGADDQPEEIECETCEGEGTLSSDNGEEEEEDEECQDCEGSGTVEPSDDSPEMQEWIDGVRDCINDALGNCPL